MSKPALLDIPAAIEGWDAWITTNVGIMRDGPMPVKEYNNAAALPAAGANDRCLAFKEITTGLNPGWRPTWSDGATWRYIPDNTQAYFDDGAVRVGTTPAASGSVRLSNANTIKARNAGNSADVSVVQVNASDQVELGGAGVDVVESCGNSTTKGTVGAVIDKQTTDAGNPANTTETDLHTKILSANFFNANQRGIRCRFDGKFGATANNKQLRVKFGGTTVIDSGVITDNATRWTVILEVFRTGSNAQRWRAMYFKNNVLVSQTSGTASETDSGTITVKCTGQSGTSGVANDVVEEISTIEYLG